MRVIQGDTGNSHAMEAGADAWGVQSFNSLPSLTRGRTRTAFLRWAGIIGHDISDLRINLMQSLGDPIKRLQGKSPAHKTLPEAKRGHCLCRRIVDPAPSCEAIGTWRGYHRKRNARSYLVTAPVWWAQAWLARHQVGLPLASAKESVDDFEGAKPPDAFLGPQKPRWSLQRSVHEFDRLPAAIHKQHSAEKPGLLPAPHHHQERGASPRLNPWRPPVGNTHVIPFQPLRRYWRGSRQSRTRRNSHPRQ